MHKVSFIIVAYNAENVINSSLESLLRQDYPRSHIEVILVDGMSEDGTRQRMLAFSDQHKSFCRVIVKDNPGRYLACGWNVALKEVTGDVVIRVDAHTQFPSDFITQNISRIDAGEDICGGKVLSILQNDTPWGRVLLAAENSMFGGGFTFFRRGEKSRYTNTLAFAAYRKRVFDEVGSYNEKLVRTEDNEMHYRMRKNGFKFYFDPKIVSYRYNRNTLIGLLRQKFLNGYWVGLTHSVEPMAFSVFYLVPLFLVLAFIAGGMLFVFSPLPIVILCFAYCIILLLAVVGSIIKSGWHPSLLAIPGIIAGLHILYGVGTIRGLCEEDCVMKGSAMSTFYRKKSFCAINKLLYWAIEIIILPFKACIWFFRLLISK